MEKFAVLYYNLDKVTLDQSKFSRPARLILQEELLNFCKIWSDSNKNHIQS